MSVARRDFLPFSESEESSTDDFSSGSSSSTSDSEFGEPRRSVRIVEIRNDNGPNGTPQPGACSQLKIVIRLVRYRSVRTARLVRRLKRRLRKVEAQMKRIEARYSQKK